ncbi:hypothetical protein CFSAN002237_23540 [Escherichia coli O104:H21 str. CFSAN002237]|nr:hypothetical protein CFSAN002237_23540 [Escherichia coli O104:H21 str. CFSAN002237]
MYLRSFIGEIYVSASVSALNAIYPLAGMKMAKAQRA